MNFPAHRDHWIAWLRGWLAAVLWLACPVAAWTQIYVANYGGTTVGEYNLSTGAAINAGLVSGVGNPWGVVVGGNNLYVVNTDTNSVGEYNASTGAVINANFITGLNGPEGLALAGNVLFEANSSGNTIGAYNASTGATINLTFSGLSGPVSLAVSGNSLYVANNTAGTVGAYNVSTGVAINPTLVTGLTQPGFLAVSGNILYVSNGTTIGKYNATTGATINANFLTGINRPDGLAIVGNTLYMANRVANTVAEYNASTGALIKANFITGLNVDYNIAVAVPPPSGLTYTTNTAVYSLATAISPNTPSSAGGAVVTYSVSPALPSGLVLDPASGIISGTPTAASPVANYTVTAWNNAGSTTTTVNITVNASGPTGQLYVDAGSTVGEYNASTGGAIKASFVTGLNGPFGLATSGNTLFVVNESSGAVGEYNAGTGATINASFITGLTNPTALAISGNLLYLINGGVVMECNASTGAVINASFVTGLNGPFALAVSGNILYVANFANDTVGEYDASTGAAINASFIAGLPGPTSLAISGNNLFIGSVGAGNVVGEYDATTGAAINTAFATGTSGTLGLAILGNSLFVTSSSGVADYDATTGAAINANLVTGLTNPHGLAVLLAGTAPSALTYTHNPASYVLGLDGGANTPSTGGGTPTAYSISPALPPGLIFSTATGIISGAPTVAASASNYTVTAANQYGSTTATLNIAVYDDAPFFLTYSPSGGVYTVGVAISPITPQSAGSPVLSYSISPTLPAGLTLNTTTGVISGTPTVSVVFSSYTVTASNGGGSTTDTLFIGVNYSPPSALKYSTNPATYTMGQPISNNTPSSGGGPVASYSISPSLPAGLSLNSTTGVISGTPTAAVAASNFTVTATNNGGSTTVVVTITVNDVAPSALAYSTNPATYTLGLPISNNAPTSTGSPVLSYTVSPALPAGLVLNSSTGVISGTPSAAATFSGFTVTASNGGGSTTVTLTIAVNDVPPSALAYSANPVIYPLGVAIANNLPTSAGSPALSYSVAPALPAGLVLNPTTGAISGTPTTVSPAANYVVTGTNDAGSCGATLNITVNLPEPQLLVGQIAPGLVAEYNASTGASTQANFITVADPQGFAVSGNTLFVVNESNNVIGEYNATTGAAINASFVTGLHGPEAVAISGNTLFVANSSGNSVGSYNATTGAAINASLITGLHGPEGVAVSGNTLFVANVSSSAVGAYNATTGAAINASFITGVSAPEGLATSGNTLFVASLGNNAVGAYDTTTGAVINANFVTALSSPDFLVVFGNTLFIGNYTGKVGAYNATTGAVINASLVTGQDGLTGLAVFPSAVAPSSLVYAANPAIYTVGASITANTPSSGGSPVTAYSSSPPLPAGLTLDATTGIITGTPTALAPSSNYTVTAANPGGNTTAVLNITINDVPPSALAYSANPATYAVGVPIVSNAPNSSGGAVVSYSIAPALPTGLQLDPVAGTITGTPAALAATAAHTVTATNTGGSATATLDLAVVSPMDGWRQQYFGTTANAGLAADTADPFNTGVSNLLAFAFFGPNQSPALANISLLPQVQMANGNLFFSFTQPAGVTGVIYGAESTTAVDSGNWQSIPDTGTGNVHIFSEPIGNNTQIFLRLTVTNP